MYNLTKLYQRDNKKYLKSNKLNLQFDFEAIRHKAAVSI